MHKLQDQIINKKHWSLCKLNIKRNNQPFPFIFFPFVFWDNWQCYGTWTELQMLQKL